MNSFGHKNDSNIRAAEYDKTGEFSILFVLYSKIIFTNAAERGNAAELACEY